MIDSPVMNQTATLAAPQPRVLADLLSHSRVRDAALVLGAALLTAADVIGRLVARPQEIDVGIITALIGAPFFIAIVRRQKVREL